MLSFDIFRDDMFSAVELEATVDKVEFIPQALGLLDLFVDKPIRTVDFGFTRKENTNMLVPTTERGAPEPTPQRGGRGRIPFETTRLIQRDTIHSHELLGVISEGMPYALQLANLSDTITERMATMRRNHELTEERHRFSALNGILLDADGSTIYNYFTEYGLVAPSAISVDLTTATNIDFRGWIYTNILLPMQQYLQTDGRWHTGVEVHALAGDLFFQRVISHPRVEAAYVASQDGASLSRGHQPYSTFYWGGVYWHHYRGTANGTDIAVPSNQARFFPRGAPDSFTRVLSPGEGIEDLGTVGKDMYAYIQPDVRTELNRWVELYLGNYPLYVCQVPGALLKAQVTG